MQTCWRRVPKCSVGCISEIPPAGGTIAACSPTTETPARPVSRAAERTIYIWTYARKRKSLVGQRFWTTASLILDAELLTDFGTWSEPHGFVERRFVAWFGRSCA